MNNNYLLRILIAIDQLFNAFFGGNEDETISSRVGKHGPKWLEKLIDFFFGLNHCKNSIEWDEGEK